MPELPEVETMCRCIAAAAGCRIRDVVRPKSPLRSISISPRLDHFRRRAVGRRIAAVRRVGKRVVLELESDIRRVRETHRPPSVPTVVRFTHPTEEEGTVAACGECIVLEPRMTGLVMLEDPPDRKHTRLVIKLSGGTARQIVFWDQRGLGVARLVSPEQFLESYGPERLGPDALTISSETLRQRLSGSRRAIKVALLDQHAVAGIGNLYASEILHHASIHPATPCYRLKPSQWPKLHAAIGDILQAAIRHQGSTLRDGTYRIARNQPGDYQLFHRVYQRTEEACLRCGEGRVVRIVQAQRSTFFCPVCQQSCSSGRRG